MDSDTKEEFLEVGKRLMEAFSEFDESLRRMDRPEWERWKAGGKAVSDDFISMYPSAEGIINTVSETEADDDEDEDERPDHDDPHGPDCAMRLHSAAECTCGKADRMSEEEEND